MVKMKIIRNRNDMLIIIFGILILLVIGIGGGLIYSILFPTPKSTVVESINTLITIFVIMIGTSFVLHGFHPILLVKK